MEDDLQPGDEPYQLSFTRLMDIGGGTAPATGSTVEEGQSQALAQFEAACSDRIQPFDDSESDDEVREWWKGRLVRIGLPVCGALCVCLTAWRAFGLRVHFTCTFYICTYISLCWVYFV